ncbi:MAG: dockerin type I repeat-containing protein [Nitrospirota bacterium]
MASIALLLPVLATSAGPPPSTPPHAVPPVSHSPTVHGLERAHRRADGTVVVAGPLTGTGTVHAQHVLIRGLLSPGDSPGCLTFGGNVTFSPTATLLIEIGGTVPCTDYDQVHVAGTLTLDGAALAVALIDGFVPAWGDRFDVLDWGSLVGSFGTIDTSAATLPVHLVWNTSQLYFTGELVVELQHFADGDLAPWNAPDGQINAADVMIAMQLVAGIRVPGDLQYAHGDMNLDDTIDLADVLLIQQAVAP